MKKIITLLLACIMTMGMVGCGKPAAQSVAPLPEAEVEEPEPVVGALYNEYGVIIKVVDFDTDPVSETKDPIVWVDIENRNDHDVWFGLKDGSVNGFMNNIHMIRYEMEDEQYVGAEYQDRVCLTAKETERFALGCFVQDAPAAVIDEIKEMEFCVTLANEEDQEPIEVSEPVVLLKNEDERVSVSADDLGTVVLNNDDVKIVFGDQDYDDFYGPVTYVYVENKSDQYIGVYAKSAEIDGMPIENVQYSTVVVPGKIGASVMLFGDSLAEVKSFENLSVDFKISEAENIADLSPDDNSVDEHVTVHYTAQDWGLYETSGIRLEVKPKYNEKITVELPGYDENGVIMKVYDSAKMDNQEGSDAGWLFSVAQCGEFRLRDRICKGMPSETVFAKDYFGMCYSVKYPETQTARDELVEWAANISDVLIDQNANLEPFSRNTTDVGMYIARAVYDTEAVYSINDSEFGTVDKSWVDATEYAERILNTDMVEVEREEAAEGKYISLFFPNDNVKFDFFKDEDNLIRETNGSKETYFEAVPNENGETVMDIMQGWYYSLVESSGIKDHDYTVEYMLGNWVDQISGMIRVSIENTVSPKVIHAIITQTNDVGEVATRQVVARRNDKSQFEYVSDAYTVTSTNAETGEQTVTDESGEEDGYFYLNENNALCWYNGNDGRDYRFTR